jgi:hypothetical protein
MRQIGGSTLKRARRAALGLAVVAWFGTSLAACRDSGLPGTNTPRQQARQREFRYPAYQRSAENTPIAVAGQYWMAGPPIESIPDRLLSPVGAAGAQTLYALRGRQTPYSRLYAPAGEGRWRPYVPLN